MFWIHGTPHLELITGAWKLGGGMECIFEIYFKYIQDIENVYQTKTPNYPKHIFGTAKRPPKGILLFLFFFVQ